MFFIIMWISLCLWQKTSSSLIESFTLWSVYCHFTKILNSCHHLQSHDLCPLTSVLWPLSLCVSLCVSGFENFEQLLAGAHWMVRNISSLSIHSSLFGLWFLLRFRIYSQTLNYEQRRENNVHTKSQLKYKKIRSGFILFWSSITSDIQTLLHSDLKPGAETSVCAAPL